MKRLLPVLLFAACGSSETFHDAGDDEVAEPDAAVGDPDAASSGAVTVRALARRTRLGPGAPVAGATVLFHDGDGALVARATTGADGRAAAEVDGGGSVTVVDDQASRFATVLAVEPGDEILVGVGPFVPTTVDTAVVDMPSRGGAGEYHVRSSCLEGQSASTSVTVQMRTDCADAPPALAWTVPAGTETPDAFQFVPSLAIVDDEAIVSGTWTPTVDFAVTLTNATDIAYVDPRIAVVSGNDVVAELDSEAITPVDATASGAAAMPVGGFRTVTELVVSRSDVASRQFLLDVPAAPSTSLTLDASDLLTTPPAAMPTADGASWTSVDPAIDFLLVMIAQQQTWRWTFVAPPEAGAVAYLELPDDLAAHWSDAPTFPYLTIVESTHLAGYADARALADYQSDLAFLPSELDGAVRIRSAATLPLIIPPGPE
jgi:hypothetical protein